MTLLKASALVLASLILGTAAGRSADLPASRPAVFRSPAPSPAPSRIVGRVSVVDGRTLWFAQYGFQVRLVGIDVCELPQWAFDPDTASAIEGRLKPVPCGSFAKAWLKRAVQHKRVECRAEGMGRFLVGRCCVGGHDLALELLRVGWARSVPDVILDSAYLAAEKQAMAVRYGMWGTYVLDMNEWRARAVDRTASRRPVADYNLLRERRLDISPPFADARRLPSRTDR